MGTIHLIGITALDSCSTTFHSLLHVKKKWGEGSGLDVNSMTQAYKLKLPS